MRKIWQLWKKVAAAIGNFQFKILFSLFYLILVTPPGILVRQLLDPLSEKGNHKWEKIKDNTSTIERMRRQ